MDDGDARFADEDEIAVLGDDLLSEIIVRLPFKSVARSRCVSRSWRAAVSDDYLRRSLPLLMAVVYFPDDDDTVRCGGGGPRFACAGEDGGGDGGRRLEDCDLGFLPLEDGRDAVVCDGCNGLLLCRSPGTPELLVVEPVTRRWVALPAPAKEATLSVLAFDPSTSLDYRVINFTGWRDRGAAVEVFSSETWTWAVHEPEFGVPASCLSGSMHYHDGVLYILASEPDCLVCLDVADEFACSVIGLPEPMDGGDGRVAHSGGRLHYVSSDGELLKVWELDGDPPAPASRQWRLKHAVKIEHFVEGGGDEVRFLALHPENADVVYAWSPWKVVECDLRRRRTTTCHVWEFREGERNRVVKTWLVPSSCYLSDCLAHSHVMKCC
ncbi:putative F-box/kelch-repeat protein At1g15680 [Oryza brachyantha]|uniref:F-box domain-containing protein n=1 Tax=Oryza brachyantha TaxID=4533 RepID=J3MUN5_ORYBR|nr:putative F-box/kelch-repeat protein At1g15680 [Oryza brachyantha]